MKTIWLRIGLGLGASLLACSCATVGGNAATAAALDGHLDPLAGYEYGEDRAAIDGLVAFLAEQAATGDVSSLEPRLAEYIRSPSPTRAARQAVIRELGRFGTDRSAAALVDLLASPDLGDDAGMALQRMTDPRVTRRLLKALPAAEGEARERIVTILGFKGAPGAIPTLAADAAGNDQRLAECAVTALGRIAGPDAGRELVAVLPRLQGRARLAAWSALLACQDASAAAGDRATVDAIGSALDGTDAPVHVLAASRLTALRGAPEREIETGVRELLAADDSVRRTVGAELARRFVDDELLGRISAGMADLPEPSQVALLGILQDRRPASAAPYIRERASASSEPVRCAAIQALSGSSDVGALPVIAEAAVSASAAVRDTARTALRKMDGDEIAESFRALARTSSVPVRVEVLSAIGDRGMHVMVPDLFEMAGEADTEIRDAAIRQLGVLVDEPSWERLLDQLCAAEDDGERQALTAAAMRAGARIPGSGGAVSARLAAAGEPATRIALLNVAGRSGQDEVLPELERAALDPGEDVRSAALRALGGWNTTAALPALLSAAAQTDASARRLAVRGALDVARRDAMASTQDRMAAYRRLLDLVDHPDDRRLLLSAVADLDTPGAMTLAAGFLDDAEVRTEAEAAVIRIASRMDTLDDAARETVRRIASETSSDAVRSEAEALLRDPPESRPSDSTGTP